MQFSAISKSVVKERERHHLLIALIVRQEGEIICKAPFDFAQGRLCGGADARSSLA
jgi:hypothetical protein